MVNFGPLAAEIFSLVWGTPGNFNGFRVLFILIIVHFQQSFLSCVVSISAVESETDSTVHVVQCTKFIGQN